MSSELKGLQVRKSTIENEIKILEQEKERIVKDISSKKCDINTINQKISILTKTEPIVSEHALLRYIERVMGIDIELVKAQILTEQNKKAIQFAGNCKIKSDGVEFIVKDRCVVSVVV